MGTNNEGANVEVLITIVVQHKTIEEFPYELPVPAFSLVVHLKLLENRE